MSRAGGSAQDRAEALRKRRLAKLRRSWAVVLIAVVAAFAFGFFLPRVVFAALSSALTTLVPDSPGLPEWNFMSALSWTLGTAMALAAAVGLVRASRLESAWRKGASGERRVGRAIDALARRGVYVLHDLAMPRSRANIDHVAVTTSGVFVVDAKRYRGRLQIRSRGSQLWVNGRNRTQLLEHARNQANVVERVLAQAGLSRMRVTPVLCFVDTELPLLLPREVNGVIVCHPRSLRKSITRPKSSGLDSDQIARVVDVLAANLRPAGAASQRGSSVLDAPLVDRELVGGQSSLWDEDQEPNALNEGDNVSSAADPTPQRPHRKQTAPSNEHGRGWNLIRIADFRSRTRRSELWAALAVAIVATWVVSFSGAVVADAGISALLASAILVWPVWGASVNRLHDLGQSGWVSLLLLVPLVNLLFVIWLGTKQGQQGPNRWGAPIT
jgi:uncharacterized membrane protein YhaH (DUF805 family)